MRKTTENKKEKIKNFFQKNKENVGEFIAIFISAVLSLVFFALNVNEPHGVQAMLCLVLFNTLWTQFYAQSAYHTINEMKKQEKKQ